MLDMRVRVFIIAIWLTVTGVLGAVESAIFGQQHVVTLRGKLFVSPSDEQAADGCRFFTDSTDDSPSIQELRFNDGEYICDFLRGSNAHAFTITLSPE